MQSCTLKQGCACADVQLDCLLLMLLVTQTQAPAKVILLPRNTWRQTYNSSSSNSLFKPSHPRRAAPSVPLPHRSRLREEPPVVDGGEWWYHHSTVSLLDNCDLCTRLQPAGSAVCKRSCIKIMHAAKEHGSSSELVQQRGAELQL
jgi:hypothetical protein